MNVPHKFDVGTSMCNYSMSNTHAWLYLCFFLFNDMLWINLFICLFICNLSLSCNEYWKYIILNWIHYWDRDQSWMKICTLLHLISNARITYFTNQGPGFFWFDQLETLVLNTLMHISNNEILSTREDATTVTRMSACFECLWFGQLLPLVINKNFKYRVFFVTEY